MNWEKAIHELEEARRTADRTGMESILYSKRGSQAVPSARVDLYTFRVHASESRFSGTGFSRETFPNLLKKLTGGKTDYLLFEDESMIQESGNG